MWAVQKQVVSQIWPVGHSLSAHSLGEKSLTGQMTCSVSYLYVIHGVTKLHCLQIYIKKGTPYIKSTSNQIPKRKSAKTIKLRGKH